MPTVTLISKNKVMSWIIKKPLTSVGNSKDCDIYVESLNMPGLAIISEANTVKVLPLDDKLKKICSGDFNVALSRPMILSHPQFQLLINPLVETMIRDIKDWDFDQLPQNPDHKHYPEQLLRFILSHIQVNMGMLLHRKGKGVTLL